MPVPDPWRPTLATRLSAGLHGTAAAVLALHPAWWPGLLGGVAANHLALAAAGAWPRSQLLGPTLHRLPQPGRRIALTFDDGPDPDATPRILDLLAASGATASFFCIGQRGARHPALLRRIVAEGHSVENHSHTHPRHFAFLVGPALRRQVEDAQAALAAATGTAPRWFRAPMGIRNPLLDPVLHRSGLRLASWTRRGYDTRCRSPAAVLSRLARRVAPGDVLMLHDGNAARTAGGTQVVLDVLPHLLARLRESGLAAVALTAAPAATPAAEAAPGSRPSGAYAST